MTVVHFITHPEVVIEPGVSVPDWRLSHEGVRRTRLMLGRPWVRTVAAVFSSGERKAREAAHMLAGNLGLPCTAIPGLGENDRSAIGYLPRDEFERVADEFFASPERSVRGWERAVDAQGRVVAAVKQAVPGVPVTGTVAVVSHGGVGALLSCHLKGVPISRTEDQPGSGVGNVFSFDADTWTPLSTWSPIEE